MGDVLQPVHPYKEGAIDHDDPNEWDRTPRKKPHSLRPQRGPAYVETERRADHRGQHPLTRKSQRPELFQRYFSIDAIRSAQAGQPPPPEFTTWIREIIEPGVAEDLRGRFMVAIDPAYRRWCLYQIVNTKNDGQACARLCVFAGENRPGYLPADLDGDIRFAHLRGAIGDFKVPTRRDFEEIRENWDRRIALGQETDIRTGATHINARLNRKEAAAYEDKNRVMNDQVLDMIEYNFRHINQAANNGTKQWSNATIVPKMNPLRWRIEQKNGYQVRTRIPSEEIDAALDRLQQLEAEMVRVDRGLRKKASINPSLARFVVSLYGGEVDVFAKLEEGQALLANLEAAPLVAIDATTAEPGRTEQRERQAEKVKVAG